MASAQRDRRTGKLTGRWNADVQYRHSDGSVTRWCKTFESKGEAEGAEAYYKATGTPPPHLAGPPVQAFTEVAKRFRERHPDWIKAHDGRTNDVRLQIAEQFFAKDDVAHIRLDRLEAFVDWLRKRPGRAGAPKSNRTLLRHVDAVMKVLRYAHKLDLIAGLPERPEIDNTGETRGILTLAQEDAVLAKLPPLKALYVRVLIATGMRCGELDGLQPEQVELPEQRELTGIMLRPEQTKANSARWVPLVPEIARDLRAALASGKLPHRAQVYEQFIAALDLSRDAETITLHSCRHTAITRMLESGATPIDVAQITGHLIPGQPKMQMRYYHPNRAHLFSVAEKVQRVSRDKPQNAVVLPFEASKKSA